MRAALIDGEVGLDGLLAVAGPLAGLGDRVGRDLVLTADAVLAAEARGEGPDGAPPACADLLRLQAQVWATVLDQDGAEPRETTQLRLRVGGARHARARTGSCRFGGCCCPRSPRSTSASSTPSAHPVSTRTDPCSSGPPTTTSPGCRPRPAPAAQQQHDALATALFVAASSELLPTIGGAAPTLVVSARAEDVINGTGWAQRRGLRRTRRHRRGTARRLRRGRAAGAGSTTHGRITRLGTEERVFNRRQRRAIALRDGGCLIPGCGVPAGWCEIHHVVEHANGGKTHTDNGVMLCWFHHRFLDLHGWEIRMNHGVPEVRAPLLVRPHPTMAHRHQIHTPTARPRRRPVLSPVQSSPRTAPQRRIRRPPGHLTHCP